MLFSAAEVIFEEAAKPLPDCRKHFFRGKIAQPKVTKLRCNTEARAVHNGALVCSSRASPNRSASSARQPSQRSPGRSFVSRPDSGRALRNVGNGAALILIADQEASSSEWQQPIRLYPLRNGDEVAVPWSGQNPKMLAATDQDANNTAYTSVCDNDLTITYEGNGLPKGDENNIKQTWQLGSPDAPPNRLLK